MPWHKSSPTLNEMRWRDYQVIRIEDESDVIRSFYLEPVNGVPPSFEAVVIKLLKVFIWGCQTVDYTLCHRSDEQRRWKCYTYTNTKGAHPNKEKTVD
jgi:hypothetical protein